MPAMFKTLMIIMPKGSHPTGYWLSEYEAIKSRNSVTAHFIATLIPPNDNIM